MALRGSLAGALVLVVAGCGAEAVPSTDDDPRTVRVETVIRVSPGDGSASHEIRSTTIVDYEHDRSETVEATTGCRSIMIGDRYYFELPSGSGAPAGKHWGTTAGLVVDLEEEFEESQMEEEVTTADGGVVTFHSFLFESGESAAPDDYLDGLRKDGAKLELVTQDHLRGTPVTHYRATIDVRERTRRELEADGWKQANVDRYLEQVPEGTEISDVWIGDDGLVRRVVTTLTEPPGWGGGVDTVTTDYVDYGLDVDIAAPPSTEVLDPDELQRIDEQRIAEEMDFDASELEEGINLLPQAFEPSAPPSCLH